MLRSLVRTTSTLSRMRTPAFRMPGSWLSHTAAATTRPSIAMHLQTSRFSTTSQIMKQVTVTFIEPDGNEVEATGEEGTNLMELAHENDVELEGACEGACACSTCHVILPEEIFDNLDEPTDEENDMLDLAFGLTDTSRLGCQVELSADMEGIKIKLPSATRNFYVDGSKPAHH
ncbi:hypothetical protein FBU59_006566 [Linderina macrospora]|uniref:Uncharacterized protein n=1 Tax=Linderina macrospora TaxID=4868 RepID=A0ACC1IZR1_9FUNG|nr:hypothetical protein FBU59_006566 [Linderina macrospora]